MPTVPSKSVEAELAGYLAQFTDLRTEADAIINGLTKKG